jgi:hypothetical protein
MVKNALKITRIAPGVSFNGSRLLQLKYDVEDKVLKIKTRWWTYKGHQELLYSR